MGIHSLGRSGSIAPELAKNHTVVIPDLRGMGLSQVVPVGYDLSAVAEDIH